MHVSAQDSLTIHDSTFNDVQGNIINHYNIQDSEQGTLILLKNISVGAAHDSLERYPFAKCPPGTQTAVLESISQWIRGSGGGQQSNVLWVHGPADVEKSEICQTIAESCSTSGDKLASFFFSSGNPGRGSTALLWATIAFQMAMWTEKLRDSVQRAVMKRPDIFSKAGVVQAKELIVEPFLGAGIENLHPKSRFLVIIDSIEECNKGEQQDILDAIASITITNRLPLLFLITSRPELIRSLAFDGVPIKHLNLLDSRGIITDLSSESTLADDDTIYTTSLVFGNNNFVPPGGLIIDKSGVLLTDSLDLSHLTEFSLFDLDVNAHSVMQRAVISASETIETFIWRFNLDAHPARFNPDIVALEQMPNLRRIIIETSMAIVSQVQGDPLPWLIGSISGLPRASASRFEALAIVIVANRFSGVGSPDHISPYVKQYRTLAAIDTALATPRFSNLRAVKIYVAGIDVNAGTADLQADIEKLMPKLRAKGILKAEILGRYDENVDFESIRTSVLQV